MLDSEKLETLQRFEIGSDFRFNVATLLTT